MQAQNLESSEELDYDKLLEKQDFFPKIFLLPSEIKLHKDEGLKVIRRHPNHLDKFEEEKVLPISIDQQEIMKFQKTESNEKRAHPAGHGLLSLFKKTSSRRIKLAICVCVYSEPKHMLKTTIKGIQANYKHFREQAGILPHEIILIVIFDGIEKINSSKDQTENMISFFNEIDIKNGFMHNPYGRSLEEYFKEINENNFKLDQLDDDKNEDICLFTEDEINQLKVQLFYNQYNEYTRIKSLLEDIHRLKKQRNIRIDSLPHDINKKYEQLCLRFCVDNNMYYETQEEIQEYLSTKRNLRVKLIYEAVHETQMLCKRYLQSRQDKAILYPVRLETEDFNNPRGTAKQEDRETRSDAKKQYNYMFFVVKHKNEGKLASHMLFFQGFCKLFDPEYCILTDVGIKPRENAIYKMWAHMEKKPKCGGVCGYMGLQLENPQNDLGYREDGYEKQNLSCLTRLFEHFFTVQRAQQFEYHFAHMLDKPFEAAFGYIHVLPGAFSGYRWKALKSVQYKGVEEQPVPDELETERNFSMMSELDDEEEETIMKRYLRTATNDQAKISLEDLNMYLAEDRIMCLGIHALGYDLDYLPDAESSVDPVTSLTRLMGQRRRWINGSWFAFNYVREHSHERSTFMFLIQLYYYSLVQKLTWIAPAIFYVAMNLTLTVSVREYIQPIFKRFFRVSEDYELYNYRVSVFNMKNILESIPDIINFVYIVIVVSIVLYSLLVNHNNQKFKRIYYLASSVLGIYGLCTFSLLIYNSYEIIADAYLGRGKEEFIIPLIYLRTLIFFILIGHGIPILWTFNFKKYVEIMTSLLSYLFYTPTYINILQGFAFCRIDDLTWGTKGLDAGGVTSVTRQWEKRKYIFVLQYLTTNVLISFVLIKLADIDLPKNILILASSCLVALLLLFRLIPAFIYLVSYNFRRLYGRKFSPQYIQSNLNKGNEILQVLKRIELKIKEIQKQDVKSKKEQEYGKAFDATSQILSKTLSKFGHKLRNKLARHMLNNNIIPKKELLDPKRRLKNKMNLRRKLKTVAETSQEEIEQSHHKTRNPATTEPSNQKIKARIQAMRNRKIKIANSQSKQDNEQS